MLPLNTLTDADLCRLVQDKNNDATAAFAELYRRHSATLYRYAYRLCSSRERAEDLVHDGFVRFHTALEHSPITQVAPYIIRIIRNQWLDRKTVQIEPEGLDFILSNDIDPEKKEEVTMLESALQQLDETSRDALLMFEIDHLSYQQIADIVGDTAAAVKTRCWRARSRLRVLLAPYMEGRL
jgi:RNA polymerase sigma-70 factor, ECF subfamily